MKWEYKTIIFDERKFLTGKVDPQQLSERLNALGDQGWELVSVVYQGGWLQTPGLMAVLKRSR